MTHSPALTLAPCPFCGGTPTQGNTFGGEWRICCTDCLATTPWLATHSNAIAAWNRRAELAASADASRAQVAQGDEVDARWQPIETAPRDLAPLLLWLPPVGGWMAGWWRGSWSFTAEDWVLHTPLLQDGKIVCLSENPAPTHWMPAPTAPAARAQQGGQR